MSLKPTVTSESIQFLPIQKAVRANAHYNVKTQQVSTPTLYRAKTQLYSAPTNVKKTATTLIDKFRSGKHSRLIAYGTTTLQEEVEESIGPAQTSERTQPKAKSTNFNHKNTYTSDTTQMVII